MLILFYSVKPGSQYVAQLRGAVRRGVTRAASVFTMFVLSGSERDVSRPQPLYPRVRIGARRGEKKCDDGCGR